MKIVTKKLLCIVFPVIIIIITGIISNVNSFNFMNYKFIIHKNIFIVFYLFMSFLLSKKIISVDCLNLYDLYCYRLHVILNIISIYNFFLYRIFNINIFFMIFNLLILIILIYRFTKLYKFSLFYILYLIWFIYLIIINLLII